jgi:hypothetical protein
MPPKCEVCGQHYWTGNPCKCNRIQPAQVEPVKWVPKPGDKVLVEAVYIGGARTEDLCFADFGEDITTVPRSALRPLPVTQEEGVVK